MYYKCQSLCRRIHGLNDKAQQMDETKKRAVVGWRRQGISILSQLLTVTAAFNLLGCCPVVLCCELCKTGGETGRTGLYYPDRNEYWGHDYEYLPEKGQAEKNVINPNAAIFSCFLESMSAFAGFSAWLLLSCISAVALPSVRLQCWAGIKTKYRFNDIANWAIMRTSKT